MNDFWLFNEHNGEAKYLIRCSEISTAICHYESAPDVWEITLRDGRVFRVDISQNDLFAVLRRAAL